MDIFDGRYEQQDLLGRGAFSEVWKVRDTQTDVELALKIYNAPTGSTDGNEMLTHEFALMVNANHRNLLRPLFFASAGDGRPYLVLPYCKRGNIGSQVGKMNEDEAWKLLHDAASALAYLHAKNPPILHQDIKPANILLADDGSYMLTDFGVSTQAKASLSRMSNEDVALSSAGTISYMAPERFSRNNLPIMANDIYSLGSTVFEMVAGFLPFGNDGGLLQKKGADIPELPGNFSPLLNHTLERCLDAEPWRRPTAEELETTSLSAIKTPSLRNSVPQQKTEAKPTTMQIPQDMLNNTPQNGAVDPSLKKTVMASGMNNGYNSGYNSGINNNMNSGYNSGMNSGYNSGMNSGYNQTVVAGGGVPPVGGTVIGSAPGGMSNSNPPMGSNSYPPMGSNSYPPNPNGGSNKKIIYGAIAAVAVIACVVLGVLFLKGNDENGSTDPATIAANDSIQRAVFNEQEFKTCMGLINQANADSVKSGVYRLIALAEKGYSEAIYEVAYTYAWVPNDGESTRRKKQMGWALDPKTGFFQEDSNNEDAVKWLQRAIDNSGETDYRCLYWLSFYYLNGQAVSRDMDKAEQLLKKSLAEATSANDAIFSKKIEDTLQVLLKMKD
ncbi:MAG: serine/threonine-protein kinase [Prevotella sp.]|nr:serine/threonine-protein kinase [Prevotella sp.]